MAQNPVRRRTPTEPPQDSLHPQTPARGPCCPCFSPRKVFSTVSPSHRVQLGGRAQVPTASAQNRSKGPAHTPRAGPSRFPAELAPFNSHSGTEDLPEAPSGMFPSLEGGGAGGRRSSELRTVSRSLAGSINQWSQGAGNGSPAKLPTVP